MMSRRLGPRWFQLEIVLAGLLSAGSQGCISASLATSTGPPPPGQRWSTAATQKAHVGEEVRFDFVLTDLMGQFLKPTGVADYAVLTLGAQRIETDFDSFGHFTFSHNLVGAKEGEKILVRASAYLQRGRRDWMKVQNRWIKTDSPKNEPDTRVAEDALDLEVYQAVVELTLEGSADEYDRESGILRFRRLDGKTTAVYADKPGRRGFTMSGPSQAGAYKVTFRPDGVDLNSTGATDVEFTIHDREGRRHSASMILQTP